MRKRAAGRRRHSFEGGDVPSSEETIASTQIARANGPLRGNSKLDGRARHDGQALGPVVANSEETFSIGRPVASLSSDRRPQRATRHRKDYRLDRPARGCSRAAVLPLCRRLWSRAVPSILKMGRTLLGLHHLGTKIFRRPILGRGCKGSNPLSSRQGDCLLTAGSKGIPLSLAYRLSSIKFDEQGNAFHAGKRTFQAPNSIYFLAYPKMSTFVS
jgi:hypothetical protein